MPTPVQQLISELLQADPSLKGREAVLESLIGELLAARPDASMDAGFRARLKARLMMTSPQPQGHLAFMRGLRLYYGLGAVAVVFLLVLAWPDAPQQVALNTEMNESTPVGLAADSDAGSRESAPMALKAMIAFSLTSSAFADGTAIPARYTCDGAGDVVPLTVSGIPDGTVSLALVMHDPDAQREGGFTHWVLYDISPLAVDALAQGNFPLGATDGANGSGKVGYIGPCPPSGTHHYTFTLYALDSALGLPSGATKEQVEAAIDGHIISETALTGLYQHQNN
jgi:Raf kinase inhibitor-like YbhB/YbcL family protein